MADFTEILSNIKREIAWLPSGAKPRRISGGSINSAFIVGEGAQSVFIKTNHKNKLTMFEAEAIGLAALKQAKAMKIPAVYCTGATKDTAYIAMEAIDMQAPMPASYRLMGEQLAALHRVKQPQYGASMNNTIGSSLQINTPTDSWYDFWREHRIGAQLLMAQQRGADKALLDAGYYLHENIESFFNNAPKASCLHGDLWQGNWGFDQSGQPLIFDPAHYYGDREADIAMTKLFGGAHPDFYAAYHDHYPMKPDYLVRENFYNLYHILNHFTLFGGSYQQQALQMTQSLISEIR